MINKEKILSILEKIYPGKYFYYKDSIRVYGNDTFLMGRDNYKKYLFILGDKETANRFSFENIDRISINENEYIIGVVNLDSKNLCLLKDIFADIGPVPCNKRKSFGTGDRLGIATPAHIRAIKRRDDIFPIIAQQSVRELNRTNRTWQDVIDDARWGYFESGVEIPFGADADHIKEINDLKEAADAGFTMFTVDPSDYIQDISSLDKSEITKNYYSLDRLAYLEKKYLGKNLTLEGKKYCIDQDILIPIAVKYIRALGRVSSLYDFLKDYKREDFDFEVSMDEIEEPVTPLEHYFISEELTNSGVNFQNLALRFVGRWEKAIDYIGDLNIFEDELRKHTNVLKKFGGYKLSLHSGSEKFSTYKLFSEITEGNFHIKTAGTSWLEALRTVAGSSPELFRDIYSFGFKCFKKDRDSYHLTTDITKLPIIDDIADNDLVDYLEIAGSRQIMHVTFGSILTSKDKKGRYYFRDEIFSTLHRSEDTHYKLVSSNISNHLNLLTN